MSTGKSKRVSKRAVAFISVLITFAAIVTAVFALIYQKRYHATSMRLLRVEGTVNIETANGGTKPVIDNIRFQSGDALSTGADGLASVGLDDTKIITLQNDSRAEFKKKNKKLELKLTKGGLFFEVTEKLSDDESFEISTTTMTVGIRGTSGYVFCDEEGRPSVIITDGKVHIVAKNPDTGEVKETDCEAGHKVTVYTFNDRPKDTVDFKEEEIEVDGLNEFSLKILAENEELLNKVCADTGWSKEEILALAADPNSFIPETDPSESSDETSESSETSAPSDTSEPSDSSSEQDPSGTSEPGATPTPTPKPKKKTTPTPTPTPDPEPSEGSSEPSQSESSEPSESESSEPSSSESSEPSQSESSEPSKSESSEPSKSESSDPSKSESSESESKETEPGETEEPDEGPEIPEDGENDSYSKEYWDPEGNGEIYILRHTISSGDGALAFEYLGYINEDWIPLDRVENDVGGFDLVYLEEDDPIVYYSIPG